MAFSKVVLNDEALIDLTNDTVVDSKLVQNYTAHGADGILITGTAVAGGGNYQSKTVSPATTSQTITPDSEYDALSSVLVEAMPLGVATAPSSISGTSAAVTVGTNTVTLSKTVSVTPQITTAGYVSTGTSGNTDVSLTATVSTHSSGDLTRNGATITTPSGYYATAVSSSVPTGTVTAPGTISGTGATISAGTNALTFSKTISVTPNVTTAGYISSGTAGDANVSLTATVSTRSSTDLSASGATVTVPSGYYASQATKSVSSGTEGTPTATKGTVSNHSISVTPSVTNTAGYISGGTHNGTAVSVSASELVSGSQTVTTNNTYDVTNLAEMVVNVSGGGSSDVQVATDTQSQYSNSILMFPNLNGEPTSFVVISRNDITSSGTPIVASVVYDGTNIFGQLITTTSNAQVSYSTDFSYSYNTLQPNALAISATGSQIFDSLANYELVYTYNGTAGNIHTADVQVGSGATSITFTGLEDEPLYWSCNFKSNFSTSSGYQRVISVVDFDGEFGLAMDSSAHTSNSYWTSSYNNGSLTITSQGTNAGGYFHQPGYYQLTYAVSGDQSLQTKTVYASTSTQDITADTGYTALKKVVVGAMSQTNLTAANIKSGTTVSVNNGSTNLWSVTGTYTGGGGGSASVATTTWTNSSTSTVSHQFTGLLGTPIAAFLRCTSQLTRSSSNTYYYIADIAWDGTNASGNYHLRSNGSYNNVASDATAKYNVTVGTNSITFSSTATSRSSAPGAFYNGTYELVYIY